LDEEGAREEAIAGDDSTGDAEGVSPNSVGGSVIQGKPPRWEINRTTASKPAKDALDLLDAARSKLPKTEATPAGVKRRRTANGEIKGEEAADHRRVDLVAALFKLHKAIDALTPADLAGGASELKKARAYLYAQAAPLGPYYEQGKNANLLHSTKKPASSRTCNLTTVAMNLEMQGRSPQNYVTTDEEWMLIRQVANEYHSPLGRAAGWVPEGTLKEKAAINLRLPDFLQVLEIVKALPAEVTGASPMKAVTAAAMEKAQKDASDNILFMSRFSTIIAGWGLRTRSVSVFKGKDEEKIIDQLGRYNKGGINPAVASLVAARNGLEVAMTPKGATPKRWTAANLSKADMDMLHEAETRYWDGRPEALQQEIAELKRQIEGEREAITAMDLEASDLKDQIAEPAPARLDAHREPGDEQPNTRGKKGGPKPDTRHKAARLISLEYALTAIQKAETAVVAEIKSQTGRIASDEHAIEHEKDLWELGVNKVAWNPEALETFDRGIVSTDKYKAAVSNALRPELEAGYTVVGHLYNHFVNVEAVTESGVTIDDPGNAGRKNHLMTWAEGRGLGAFTSFTVIEPTPKPDSAD
jgi:hypothetical protein